MWRFWLNCPKFEGEATESGIDGEAKQRKTGQIRTRGLVTLLFQNPVTTWNIQEEVAELRGEVEELQTQLLRHQVVHNQIGSDGFQCQASSMCFNSLKQKMNDILSGGGGGTDSLVRLGKVSEPGLGRSCRC